MVKLKIGAEEYPLVMTVGALDELAQMGVTLENLFQYISPENRTFAEAVEHGLTVLDVLIGAGVAAQMIQNPGFLPEGLSMVVVRHALTPGQIWGLCEAAVLEGLARTVEADHSKNAGSAV